MDLRSIANELYRIKLSKQEKSILAAGIKLTAQTHTRALIHPPLAFIDI